MLSITQDSALHKLCGIPHKICSVSFPASAMIVPTVSDILKTPHVYCVYVYFPDGFVTGVALADALPSRASRRSCRKSDTPPMTCVACARVNPP